MWKIRDAVDADVAGIFEIYHEQVLHSTATFETVVKSVGEQRAWFEQHDRAVYAVLVAEEAGRVIGWARLYPWSPRKAYLRTAENAVYIHTDARGRGVGRALLGALLDRAGRTCVREVMARISEGNPASVALHLAFGYQDVGLMRRAGEKFGRLIDVRLMQKSLG